MSDKPSDCCEGCAMGQPASVCLCACHTTTPSDWALAWAREVRPCSVAIGCDRMYENQFGEQEHIPRCHNCYLASGFALAHEKAVAELSAAVDVLRDECVKAGAVVTEQRREVDSLKAKVVELERERATVDEANADLREVLEAQRAQLATIEAATIEKCYEAVKQTPYLNSDWPETFRGDALAAIRALAPASTPSVPTRHLRAVRGVDGYALCGLESLDLVLVEDAKNVTCVECKARWDGTREEGKT